MKVDPAPTNHHQSECKKEIFSAWRFRVSSNYSCKRARAYGCMDMNEAITLEWALSQLKSFFNLKNLTSARFFTNYSFFI